MRINQCIIAGVAVLSLLAQTSGYANSLTIGDTVSVGFVSVSPGGILNISDSFYHGGAYAGIYNMNVGLNNQTSGGLVQMPTFCIDAYQFDPIVQTRGYTVSALQNAPVNKPPGAMGSGSALEIEKLWTQYYSGAISDSSGKNAVLLQAAIWMLSSGPDFSITSDAHTWTGYGSWSDWLTAYEAGAANAAPANLLALTNPNNQDYVVRVPDGGTTLSLLGLALCGLAAAGRKSNR